MKKVVFFITVTAAIFFMSCSKTPEACFTAPSSANTGTSVSFDASCSVDAHHCEWDFGDGGTAMGTTVSHTYNTAGTYTVKLTAIPKRGHNHGETTKSITVN